MLYYKCIQCHNEFEENLINLLFNKKIPYCSFRSSEGNVYSTSETHKKILENVGIEIETVETRNLSDFSSKEKNEIKRYHRSQIDKRRKKALDSMLKEYGPV